MIIWKYGNKGKLLLIFILLGVESGRNLFTAWLAAELIELMVGNGILFNSILPILIIGAIGTLIFGISKHFEAYIRTNFIKELNIRIKEILLTDIFYQRKSSISEDDLSFMTNDLKLLETNGIGSEFTILQYGIQFIVALVASLIINPLLAIVYLISSAFPYTLSRIVKDSIKDSSIKWSETNNQYTNKLKDFLSGLMPIKVYEAQEAAIHLVKKSAINMEESLQKMNFIVQATNDWTMTLIDLMKTIIPYSVAAFMIMGNYLEFAEFIVVNRLAGFLVAPIVVTINSKNKIRETEPIQEKIEHANQRLADLSLDNNNGSLHFSKSIQLKDVGVKYGSKTIFDNLNILFKKGEKVLLMAPSGFGKSTLLKLLNSTIEIDSGQFLVDNQVVNDEKEINRLFSFISQQPKLFNDSLEFNITLGRQFSEEEIMKAVEFSELKELVDDKGMSYIVGNDGNNLSGGQKQRVEIARAIINNRPIILADEMTANLDDELSNVIRQKFLASNLTLIEAAHRVTMEEMKQYDEVFKLDAL